MASQDSTNSSHTFSVYKYKIDCNWTVLILVSIIWRMEKGREKLPSINHSQCWLLIPNFVKTEVTAKYALIDNYYILEESL